MRPSVFIGSSTEGLEIARDIRSQLKDEAEITIWSEGVFGLNKGTLETLVSDVTKYDFGILVLSPDDMTQSREQSLQSPRDNVLFECGLFMGSLGRDRTFIVYDKSKEIKIPSDLAGVKLALFDGNRILDIGEIWPPKPAIFAAFFAFDDKLPESGGLSLCG